MHTLSTIVVHDRAAPAARELLALCTLHLSLLRGHVRWVRVDEVVGSSHTLACQVCTLLDGAPASMHLATSPRHAGNDAPALPRVTGARRWSAGVEAQRAAGA